MSFVRVWITSFTFLALPLGPALPLCATGAGPLLLRGAIAALIVGTVIIAPVAIASSLSKPQPG